MAMNKTITTTTPMTTPMMIPCDWELSFEAAAFAFLSPTSVVVVVGVVVDVVVGLDVDVVGLDVDVVGEVVVVVGVVVVGVVVVVVVLVVVLVDSQSRTSRITISPVTIHPLFRIVQRSFRPIAG